MDRRTSARAARQEDPQQQSIEWVESMLRDLEDRLTGEQWDIEGDELQQERDVARQIAVELRRLREQVPPADLRVRAMPRGDGGVLAEAIGSLGHNVAALTRHADLDGSEELRQEVAEIRHAVELLAHEERLRAQERDDTRRTPESARELARVAARLEEVREAIRRLSDAGAIRSLEEKLRRLARSVEQLVLAQSGVFPGSLPLIHARLDEIAHSLAAADKGATGDAVKRIEGRLTSLARQLDQLVSPDSADGVAARLAQLAGRVDELNAAIGVPTRTAADLEAKLDRLAERMDEVLQTGDRLDRLEGRLEKIAHMLGAPEGESVFAALDRGFSAIGRQIDGLAASGLDPELLGSLERQLVELNRQLSKSERRQPPGQDGVGQDQIREAAHEAAAAALLSLPATEAGDGGVVALAQELRELEGLARQSEERNSRTFEAVHDTLLTIMDRLAGLEGGDQGRKVPEGKDWTLEPIVDDLTVVAGTGDKPQHRPDAPVAGGLDLIAAARRAVRAASEQSPASGTGRPSRYRAAALAVALVSAGIIAGYAPARKLFDNHLPTVTAVPDQGLLLAEVPEGSAATSLLPSPASAPATLAHAAGMQPLEEAVARQDPRALFAMGLNHAEGRASGPDLEEAARWFERAAERGYAPAQYRLASLLEKGLYGPRDIGRAVDLYMQAAKRGSASAMHNLGVLFATGTEGRPDHSAAAHWFLEAAKHGVTDSQYNFAILLAKGLGVEQDLVEACKWFAIAARSGDAEAQRRLDELAASMPPEDVEKARQMAGQWRALPLDPRANALDLPKDWRIYGTEYGRVSMQRLLSKQTMAAAEDADGLLAYNPETGNRHQQPFRALLAGE